MNHGIESADVLLALEKGLKGLKGQWWLHAVCFYFIVRLFGECIGVVSYDL